MDTSTENQPVISEELWRAWAYQGKQREQAIARKRKVAVGAVIVLVALASAIYLLIAKFLG